MRELINKNPLRFLVRSVVTTFIVLVALFIVVQLSKFNGNGNHKLDIVPTDSMYPEIKSYGIVDINPDVKFEEIELGDIIKFKVSALPYDVIHRVVGIRQDGTLITKGDNNKLADSWEIGENEYKGKVESINNDYSEVLIKLLGKADINNFGKVIKNVMIVLISSAVIISILIVLAYYILDVVTSNIFWLTKQDKMQKSIQWMDETTNSAEFNKTVEKYKKGLVGCNLLTRIKMYMLFSKYYSVVCSQEKYDKKAIFWKRQLDNQVYIQLESHRKHNRTN